MAQFDVAVIGLGAMGSAALRELARRGVRAAGIERFTPGHDRGSSHGESRIIRLGYFEHPSYVPLLRRTYELWRELEAVSAQPLMHITGIVEIGPPGGEVVAGTLRASREHHLPHEVLDAAQTMRRFPAFRIPPDYAGVFQPDGGFVAVEPSIAAQLALAKAAGAALRTNETVRAIVPGAHGVRVETDHGSIDAGIAIVAAGPWLKTILPQLAVSLRVTRQAMAWFEPIDDARFAGGRFPVFLLESRHGVHYGFPPHGGAGVKIAKHHHANETVDPDGVDRTVSAADEALIRQAVADHIPAANGKLLAAKTCLYTVTPDRDFIVDRLPGAPNILVASPCSGHGFKFAPVIGEILADLAIDGNTRHDISRFRLARFGGRLAPSKAPI
jgi:sarcosine oxidase